MIPKKRDKIGMPVSYQRDGYRVNEEIPVGILLDSAGPTLISPTSIRVVKTPFFRNFPTSRPPLAKPTSKFLALSQFLWSILKVTAGRLD
jgi:hypothetical protein